MGGLSDLQRIGNSIIGEQQVIRDEPEGFSYLGTPVHGRIEFPSVTYDLLDGTSKITNEMFFDTALVSVSQQKTIITTAIQGRPGTVKEYISKGDYSISIELRVNTNQKNNVGAYPTDQITDLVALLEATIETPIISLFLNDVFGVDSIVVTDYTVPQQAGIMNNVPVLITAISEPTADNRQNLEQ